jgi:hypothetical protein
MISSNLAPPLPFWKTTLLLLCGVVLAAIASTIFGKPWMMPILGVSIIYPPYIWLIVRQNYRWALFWVLLWAIAQSVAIVILVLTLPEVASQLILRGESYRSEVFHWIETGHGYGENWQSFLPAHLKEYVLFCLLSLFTLGFAALLLGTYLLNFMNYYVGSLIAASNHPFFAAAIAWAPWSLLRVLGYICTGIGLSALGVKLILYLRGQDSYNRAIPYAFLIIGFGCLVGDLVVKRLLAPFWREWLAYALFGQL